ncbi:hypothetical protein DPMN_025751 [Dreissena polymorpha]|uniref:Uncharacterized protein n=1 Tax=Dreissena polymorpha TaxID=45954 RepID=A0A9D4LPU4_DREPO|nr:hypothetical protein DPMN_025751 [Dreissena polymorpha]
MAMDKASEVKDTDGVRLGKQILTLAVLSIIITAPVGAAVIALTGPRLLHCTEQGQCQEEERVEGQEEKGWV